MAQNVDLMVIGNSDGLSATELTQRLITEFGQSGEVFVDLVAAACEGAPPYAAQSGVSLDTAVEGQMQLEKVGVVCQVIMDGKLMGQPASAPPKQPVEEPEPEIAQAPVASPRPDTADVSFGDELDLLRDNLPQTDSTANESIEPEKGVEDEDIGDISFDDELVSFDDDVAKNQQKLKQQENQAAAPVTEPEYESRETDSVEFGDPADDLLAPAAPVAEVPAELDPALDDVQASAAGLASVELPAVAKQGAGDELALSLSEDDSQPLTKPRVKSDKVPDDGGLTLSLDDETPLTAVKKVVAEPQPEALDITQTLDDSPTVEAPVVTAEVVEIAEEQIPTPTEPMETSSIDEARDTSTEPKEVVAPAPVLDEPEHQEPASPKKADRTETQQPIEQQSTVENSENSTEELAPQNRTEPEPVAEVAPAESKPFVANSLNSLIDELSSSTAGLVLPGQTAASPAAPAVRSGFVAEDGSAPAGLVLPGQVAAETAAPIEQSIEPEPVSFDRGTDNLHEEDDDSYRDVEVVFEKDGKIKLIKTAVAASVVAALLGAGAVYYISGGLDKKSNIPVVVDAAPINDNSILDAVEEGSLNAAIKRSSDVNNPDNYSTEELIAYLSEDLGQNAQRELQNYVSGDGNYEISTQSMPRMGAAIPADSNSVLWLKNRVAHSADKYFDEWTKREVDLQAYMELQERLIEVGDMVIARDVSGTTKDKLFAVMSLQRLARAYHELGRTDEATQALKQAARNTYSIASDAERTIAIADYALSEWAMDLREDSLDSFLKASILARSLGGPESRTVALSAIAGYFHKAEREQDMTEFLDLAMVAAYELPVNTAARDLAIRHVALTEVRLGLAAQATDHANLIVDPFAAVSALHGIALELERIGDKKNASLTLNMAYRAGSLIKNSEKREKLLEKIKLAGG